MPFASCNELPGLMHGSARGPSGLPETLVFIGFRGSECPPLFTSLISLTAGQG